MRTSRSLTTLLALALVATACAGGGDEPAAGGATAPATPAEAAATADGGKDAAFPVTIEHRHGATTIESPPERVVTVGLTDHDAVLALGVTPVGTRDWYGDHPHAVWPWAQDELGNAEPEVVGTAQEIDFETVASLDPDVIVGLYSAMTSDEYETLSQIAPTVAQPDDHVDYGVPWQELTRTVGRIVGQADEADALVAEVEDRFAAVREEHPEFVGATAAGAAMHEGIYVYSPKVANMRLLQDLGFEVPDGIAELVGEADGAQLSLERAELIDTDVLLWIDAQPGQGPLGEPVYTELDVHQEGREVLLSSTGELSAASFVSVLSIPEILDGLVPMLEAAVDGDPDTEVPSG